MESDGRDLQGMRAQCGPSLQRLHNRLLVEATVLGNLVQGGGAPQPPPELLGGTPDGAAVLPLGAGDLDAINFVAEVALELAHDRRGGEGGEAQPQAGFVALQRLEQCQHGDLNEVL